MTGEFRIRFISNSDWVSSTIRRVTRSLWSHTEIILDDGSYLGAHYDGGVQIRPSNYCSPLREKRYSIRLPAEQVAQIISFAHSQVGKKYDISDIFGILFNRNWDNPSRWICSELVAASAYAGGLYLLNVDPKMVNKITPEMLHLSPYLITRCYYSMGA